LDRDAEEQRQAAEHTFEGDDAPVDEEAEVAVAHVAGGAGGPEERARHAGLPGGVHAEAHQVVRHDARDAVKAGEEAPQVRRAVVLGGVADGRRVLRGVGVGLRQAVRDGGEAEPREARDGGGAAGADEAAVVVLGVDEGDAEAPGVEDLGQLQHRRDVALRRERHAHCVRLRLRLRLLAGRERSRAHVCLDSWDWESLWKGSNCFLFVQC
jgi:hypothetical protein